MAIVLPLLMLAGFWPLWEAWRANRTTSLGPAIVWTALAWLGWTWAFTLGRYHQSGFVEERYVALCLTGAAGVAVLGARRPYVGAWNFVVLGLLGVLLLPLAENAILGTDPADPLRISFLSATLAVGLLNYLPTRFAVVALMMGLRCANEIVLLYMPDRSPEAEIRWISVLVLLLTPWTGWILGRKPRTEISAFDRQWLDFRDRFGLLWGQRVRDHFNHAAKHAGWPVTLGWGGLITPCRHSPEQEVEMLETLRAVLKRFM